MAQAVGMVGLGSSLAGGLFSAFGANKTAEAKQQMYLYQARVAKQNADYAIAHGEEEAVRYGIGAGQRRGKIIAAQGASGLDVNSGSNRDVQTSQDFATRMDFDTIRTNAARTAYNYRTQATMAQMSAKNARDEGDINMIGSLIGTASSVSSKWLAGNQQGLWNGTALGG